MQTTTFCPIVKSEKLADGTLRVWGKATGPDLDSDQQILDPTWLSKAMPEWFQWGNIREQHTSIAAGVATELEQSGNDWMLESLVVDASSVAKVEAGVLKGYSVGIRAPKVIKDVAAPGGRIVGGSIVEVSLVDRPANPTCTLTLAKSVDGALTKIDAMMMAGDAETELDVAEADLEPEVANPELEAEQAAELPLLEQARNAIAALIADEAAELAAGTGGAGPLRVLLCLLDDLCWYEEYDKADDLEHLVAAMIAGAKPAAANQAPEEEMMNLSTVADLVKAASAPDATEVDTLAIVELRKALGIEDTNSKLAAVLTKATKALEELEQLAPRLAKVEDTVVQSGPHRIRDAASANKAGNHDTTVVEVRRLQQLASGIVDPELAKGYRELAALKAAMLD